MSNDIDPTAAGGAGGGKKRRESSKLIYYWRKTEIKCSATACEIYEADVLPTFVLCGFGFNIFNSRYSPPSRDCATFPTRLLCTKLIHIEKKKSQEMHCTCNNCPALATYIMNAAAFSRASFQTLEHLIFE